MDELNAQNPPENPADTPSRRQKKGKFKSQVNLPSSAFGNGTQKLGDTGEMGISSQEFWKQSNKDVTAFGFDNKSFKSNKIIPIVPSSTNGDMISRQGTSMERYKYDKEKQRDPATEVAALKYKKLHVLRDEINDSKFSYFCSSAEKILDNSNSHPSFRIYYSFVKRFMVVAFILCMLSATMLAYNGTSNWYDNKDVKWRLDHISLGNIDGLEYQAEGSILASVQKDNADKGKYFTLSIDMLMTILMILFFLYQIDVSRVELRSRNALKSVTDYAVRVTSLPKTCPENMDRDLRILFTQFGKIQEIVPLRNYSKALPYEIRINNIGERINDIKSIDHIKSTNSQKKIDDLVAKEEKLNLKQKKVYDTISRTGRTRDYIVVFDTAEAKKDCMSKYNKYSHWWSRPQKSMPNDLRLQGKIGFKVKNAPEPSEYILENGYRHWILKLFVIFLAIGIAVTVSIFALNKPLTNVSDKYDDIPIYKECNKYFFNNVNAATYLNAVTTNANEVNCFCRNLGYSTVEKDTGDNKTLCKTWLDSFDKYYVAVVLLIGVMLALNIFLTYFFKVMFNPKIFCIRNQTNRFLLTSVLVCAFHFAFLGFLPEYWMGTEALKLGRVWYLKAAPIYALYLGWSLILYPLETGIYWLFTFVSKKIKSSKPTLQKQLNKAVIGPKLDYSHKIGRLMAYAFIAFYHGASIPILYIFFFMHIGIFILVEKALMLKFYRRFEHIQPYIRQFLIHVLLLMLFFHFFRAIDILGSEEIFPSSYSETIGLKSGTLLYYYVPKTQKYGNKIILPQGIGYFLFALALFGFYCLIWWSHRENILGKFLSWCAILERHSTSPARLQSLRQRNMVYYPDTYKFEVIHKYQETLPPVEKFFNESNDIEARLDVPAVEKTENMESNFGLNKSGDDSSSIPKSKDGRPSAPVYNIYKKGDNNKQPAKKASSDSDDDSSDE